MRYVPVWIQKEQWMMKVELKPHETETETVKHEYYRTKVRRSLSAEGSQSSPVTLFEATLLDIATGMCYGNYSELTKYIY